jgi:hypothetical protein
MNRRKILKAIGAVPITASIGLPLAKAFAQSKDASIGKSPFVCKGQADRWKHCPEANHQHNSRNRHVPLPA